MAGVPQPARQAAVDPQGNAVTLTYDASLRLVAVADAIGQVTTLAYTHPTDIYKITKVTDPVKYGINVSDYTTGLPNLNLLNHTRSCQHIAR
jgi:YD repeat-containing protein